MQATPRHDPGERGGDTGARLRRAPTRGWALGQKERRARQAVEQALRPTPRSAHTIAMEQLAHVRDITEDQPEPLVIDLDKLRRNDAPEAAILRLFTDDIVSRRRATPNRHVVFLREEDLDMLGGLLTCAPDDVTPLLERLDVLGD